MIAAPKPGQVSSPAPSRQGREAGGGDGAVMLAKYRTTAVLAATSYIGDSPLFLVDFVVRLARVAVLLTIWRTVFAGRGPVGGMTLGAVLTYTLAAEVFADPLNVRSELSNALWQGTIAVRLLQPFGIVGQFVAETSGQWLIRFGCFSLPLLALAPLLGVNPLPASPSAALWFLVSLTLAIAVGFALDFLFTVLIVALETSQWAVEYLRRGLPTLLSGALLPLALMPWGIGTVFGWLPFASMASAPLRLYTGTGDPHFLLPLQAGWAIVLAFVGHRVWQAQREGLVGYGG
jgi:ABC-2 type transport system permease protein